MSTAEALGPMGLKRICTNCGVRFYDMNNRPIICPSCDTEFTGEVKLKSRRGRTPAAEKKVDPLKELQNKGMTDDEDDNDLLDDEDDGVEVVSLDDADDDDKKDDKRRSSTDGDDDDDDDLDDIPDFDDPIVDELDDDDDTLLDEDDD